MFIYSKYLIKCKWLWYKNKEV